MKGFLKALVVNAIPLATFYLIWLISLWSISKSNPGSNALSLLVTATIITLFIGAGISRIILETIKADTHPVALVGATAIVIAANIASPIAFAVFVGAVLISLVFLTSDYYARKDDLLLRKASAALGSELVAILILTLYIFLA
ncbi:hypothetical protein ISS21_02855 [Patescibacteria group bacterium]|nr:hypothetical protein [Patescibacteria group bacterium]